MKFLTPFSKCLAISAFLYFTLLTACYGQLPSPREYVGKRCADLVHKYREIEDASNNSPVLSSPTKKILLATIARTYFNRFKTKIRYFCLHWQNMDKETEEVVRKFYNDFDSEYNAMIDIYNDFKKVYEVPGRNHSSLMNKYNVFY